MPARLERPIYRSGDWEIDLVRREMRLRGEPAMIGGRAFEIVEVLVKADGELVDKYALMDRIWPGAVVEENTLQAQISAVRKALGADRALLKTVAGRGYRLIGGWIAHDQDMAPAAAVATTNPERTYRAAFPAPASPLIGRAGVVQQVCGLLSANRAVTLTGPGGIGKTVLALEVARSLASSLESDGLLVELAALSDATLVPSAIASRLELKLGGGDISSETVASAIGSSRMLLVLDNCEHIIDAVAELAETLIGKCPNLSILATSREVLRIDGEYVYRVPPLAVPPECTGDTCNVLTHGAVQLLLARIVAQQHDFSPDEAQLRTMAAICRRLDGIPLAIEFAAARAATLGLDQVADGLDDRFAVLTGGRRTALPRHQTLRAALDWSYDLLSCDEQRLLRRLSAFACVFAADAAIAVLDDTDRSSRFVTEGIANLVAKSLVSIDVSVSPTRWRLLETIRAYALEKLAECDELEPVMQRHAEFYRDLMGAKESTRDGAFAAEQMARNLREIDNVRAALDWSFSERGDPVTGVMLTAGYAPVLLYHTLMVECRDRVQRALESAASHQIAPAVRMQLLIALGVALIFTVGPVSAIKCVLAEALELAESLDDADAELRTLWSVWTLHFNIGDCVKALGFAERFARVARRLGDRTTARVADRLIADTLHYGGRHQEARQLLERVLDATEEPASRSRPERFHYDQRVLARTMLARTRWMQGDIDAAISGAEQSFAEAKAGHQLSVLYALGWALVPIHLMIGEFDAAERYLRMLSNLAAQYNTEFWKLLGRCLEGKLLIAKGDYIAGHAILSKAFAECERAGWTICFPEFQGVLAEGFVGLGQITDALATLDRAIARANAGGECWYLPELRRLKGEALVRQADTVNGHRRAEACFVAAIAVSQKQGALYWELRAALSLARLKRERGHVEAARAVLEPVYQRFPRERATSDLRASAHALGFF